MVFILKLTADVVNSGTWKFMNDADRPMLYEWCRQTTIPVKESHVILYACVPVGQSFRSHRKIDIHSCFSKHLQCKRHYNTRLEDL